MISTKSAHMTGWLALLAILIGPMAASAQPAEEPESLEEVWTDLLHYIKVAQPEAARSYAGEILQRDVAPREIYLLTQRSEFRGSERTLQKGLGLTGLEEPLSRILDLIEDGYRAVRSDPEQIARSIEMLSGTLESYERGRQRLIESGEYALPQMIAVLMDPTANESLKIRVASVLPDMGRLAVRGLSVALQARDPKIVQAVADALAEIEYPHAAPRLREAMQRDDLVGEARQAVRTALITVAGQAAVEKPAAEVFYTWAENYYDQAESLLPDPREDMAFVWSWQHGAGLAMVAVPREIFTDVYAMRMARLALQHDPEYFPAVPLWIAASARREVRLPEGATDPLLGPDELHARDYILATSPQYLQQALARVLVDGDAEVAMMVIRGLAETQGTESLVAAIGGGAQPLVQAMTYPDRRVRFLAGITLARALPQEKFNGYQLVVPTLNEALRQTGERAVVLVGKDNRLRSLLTGAGFAVEQGDTPEEAVGKALAGPGYDAFVVAGSDDAALTLDLVRSHPMLMATPVLAVGSQSDLRPLAAKDDKLIVLGRAPDSAAIGRAMADALTIGAGAPMETAEAVQWSIRAARALETVGSTGNEVYDLTRAIAALTGSLDSESGDLRKAVADALSVIRHSRAQQATAGLALDATASEDVRISAFVSLSRSLKRYGDLLMDDQVQEIVDTVVGTGSRELRTAASRALGAANLPSVKIKDLILSAESD